MGGASGPGGQAGNGPGVGGPGNTGNSGAVGGIASGTNAAVGGGYGTPGGTSGGAQSAAGMGANGIGIGGIGSMGSMGSATGPGGAFGGGGVIGQGGSATGPGGMFGGGGYGGMSGTGGMRASGGDFGVRGNYGSGSHPSQVGTRGMFGPNAFSSTHMRNSDTSPVRGQTRNVFGQIIGPDKTTKKGQNRALPQQAFHPSQDAWGPSRSPISLSPPNRDNPTATPTSDSPPSSSAGYEGLVDKLVDGWGKLSGWAAGENSRAGFQSGRRGPGGQHESYDPTFGSVVRPYSASWYAQQPGGLSQSNANLLATLLQKTPSGR